MPRVRAGLAGTAGGLVALVACLVALGPLFLKPGSRLPLTTTPGDLGLAFETVAFPSREAAIGLRAWWIRAGDAKAAIVMVHGGGEDNRAVPYADGLRLARDLVRARYAVLMLDLRNYGESDAAPDGVVTFGEREADDVLGAVDYLRGRFPALRVGALGFSMGGSTVLYAAARELRLEAVVTDGAFAESRSIAGRFVRAATGLPMLLAAPLVWSAETLHGVPLGRGRAIDLVGDIAPRPVLLIHNAADPIVPLAHVRRLAAACPSAETWIDSAPPADHPLARAQGGFGTHIQSYKLAPATYAGRVTAFLDRTFASPGAP
jgi:pimeloyl-ACP methyl ester carboxylesterase